MTSTATSVLRAARPLFRSQFAAANARHASLRAGGLRIRPGPKARRWQSTTAEAKEAPKQTWFQRMLDSPVGLKTVHFWAPVLKWVLVLAGVADFARPAEKLSLFQNVALTATGLIWTRWSLIIKPKNHLLAAVNFFLGIVGIVQVSRIAMYKSAQKSLPEKAEDKAEEVASKVKDAVKP